MGFAVYAILVGVWIIVYNTSKHLIWLTKQNAEALKLSSRNLEAAEKICKLIESIERTLENKRT